MFHILVIYVPHGDAYYLGLKVFNGLPDRKAVIFLSHEIQHSDIMPCISGRNSHTIQPQRHRKNIDLLGVGGNKEYAHIFYVLRLLIHGNRRVMFKDCSWLIAFWATL